MGLTSPSSNNIKACGSLGDLHLNVIYMHVTHNVFSMATRPKPVELLQVNLYGKPAEM